MAVFKIVRQSQDWNSRAIPAVNSFGLLARSASAKIACAVTTLPHACPAPLLTDACGANLLGDGEPAART
jgi:hypothetical protein